MQQRTKETKKTQGATKRERKIEIKTESHASLKNKNKSQRILLETIIIRKFEGFFFLKTTETKTRNKKIFPTSFLDTFFLFQLLHKVILNLFAFVEVEAILFTCEQNNNEDDDGDDKEDDNVHDNLLFVHGPFQRR